MVDSPRADDFLLGDGPDYSRSGNPSAVSFEQFYRPIRRQPNPLKSMAHGFPETLLTLLTRFFSIKSAPLPQPAQTCPNPRNSASTST